jgi:hypothetical protein
LVRVRFSSILILENHLWKQRYKNTWKLQGARNTNFFHAWAIGRKQKNHISTLLVNGQYLSDHNSKARALLNHFCSLMGSDSDIFISDIQWQDLFSQQINIDHLTDSIFIQEIIDIINSWPSGKSPGPNKWFSRRIL